MPPKPKRVLPGKRYPLNMRTTKELRDQIGEAAIASGRSLVQEVELRLEQSFRRDDTIRVLQDALVSQQQLIRDLFKELAAEVRKGKSEAELAAARSQPELLGDLSKKGD
jgi:hypothetical protein